MDLSQAMKKLTARGLSRDAVIVLVKDRLNGIGKRDIRLVQIADAKGGDPGEWPEDLRVREFPRAK